MNNSLSGKVVIITGASSGIGAATARAMAELGCKMTLAARSADKLNALADSLDAETLVIPTDLTIPSEIITMIEKTIEKFGRKPLEPNPLPLIDHKCNALQ